MNSDTRPVLLDRDKLNSAPKDAVAKGCVRVFDSLQTFHKEVQLLSMAAAFVILAQALNFPAQDAFTAAKNLMVARTADGGTAARDGWDHRFSAMLMHATDDLSLDAPDSV